MSQTQSEDSKDEGEDDNGEEPGSASGKSRATSLFQDWDKTQLLDSIHQSIDWLHRLSNLVRKASFANQNKRAHKFKLEDADGNDLTETFTNYYTKLIKRDFNGLQNDLTQRLAVSMVTRRRRIMYRKSRQRHWNLPQVEYTAKRLEPSHQPRSSVISQPTKSPRLPKLPLQKERAITQAQSHLTSTTLDINTYRRSLVPSGVSKGSTTPLTKGDEVLVPPPPMPAGPSENFVCDYCCLILQSEIGSNKSNWK